jgi:hypothetical protein
MSARLERSYLPLYYLPTGMYCYLHTKTSFVLRIQICMHKSLFRFPIIVYIYRYTGTHFLRDRYKVSDFQLFASSHIDEFHYFYDFIAGYEILPDSRLEARRH